MTSKKVTFLESYNKSVVYSGSLNLMISLLHQSKIIKPGRVFGGIPFFKPYPTR